MRAGRTVGVAGRVSVAGDAGTGEKPWRSRVGMTDARSRSGGAGVLQGARQAPRTGRNVQLAGSNIGGASLTRAELREELDRFGDEMLGHYATKADLATLETRLVKWMAGLQLASIAATATIVAAAIKLLG